MRITLMLDDVRRPDAWPEKVMLPKPVRTDRVRIHQRLTTTGAI